MKIITLTQVKNAENTLPHFYGAYIPFSDAILVSDLGSKDGTHAFCAKNINIGWTNAGLVEAQKAIFEGDADWIVFSSVIQLPTWILRDNLRGIIKAADQNGFKQILCERLFVHGEDQYFAGAYSKEVRYTGFAWKIEGGKINRNHSPLQLDRPFCVLNHRWANNDIIFVEQRAHESKNEKAKGELGPYVSPVEWAAPLEDLPKFSVVSHPPVRSRK